MADFCVLGFYLKFDVILLATVTSHVSTFFKFLCLSVASVCFCQLEQYHQNHTRAALRETETMSRIEVPLG